LDSNLPKLGNQIVPKFKGFKFWHKHSSQIHAGGQGKEENMFEGVEKKILSA